MRGEHFSALREAVADHGGTEVKNTGDGVLATFASAVEAVAAAVAMQQATHRHARSSATPLAIRVGMSIGEVAFDDGDVFGTPVVEAARLVAAARPGQILTTTLLRAMAGTRAAATFNDLGTVALKGLPDPMAVCEVAWEPAAEGRRPLPLPVLLTATGRISVGRAQELERLRQLWKEAREGERRTALLGGEPGVGKTRLAAELAAAVHGDGAVVLAGRCDEDLGVPYQPFVEALRHYVGHAAEPRLGRHAGELPRLVPELVELVPGLAAAMQSDPETERYRLFDAVAAWLADLSAEGPVLLVLDDLQWAAKPTLLLLRHVLRFDERLHLLVLATYRDTELSRGHPLAELLADLRRQSGVERVPLAGLDCTGVAAFLAEAGGQDLNETDWALAQAIHAETEGNPFFVGEVVRHLTESGAVARDAGGRWRTTVDIEDLGIPEGIREVVGRRLSRLSAATNRLLGLASVIGLDFDLGVLQAVSGGDEDELLGALDEAAGFRLVADVSTSAPRYRFAHNLVRATLYEELSPGRRVILHRRAAEAIEAVHAARLDDHLAALAHHYARAAAPAAQTEKAVGYARRAGDRALALLAHDEAARWYAQALDLLAASDEPDSVARLDLLIALGEAQRRAADPAHRQTLLDAAHLARARGDAGALARAALANTRGVMMTAAGSVDREKVAVLEAAVDGADTADAAVRARLLATLALESASGDRRRALHLTDEALALARRLGDETTLAFVLGTRFFTLGTPDTLRERFTNAEEFVATAEDVGDPFLLGWSLWQHSRAATEAGQVVLARTNLEKMGQVVADVRQPLLRWYWSLATTAHLVLAGRLDEARRLAMETAEIGRATAQPDGPMVLALFAVGFATEDGRWAEAEAQLPALKAATPGLALTRAMDAFSAAEDGRLAEARSRFEAVASEGFHSVPFNLLWMITMAWLATVAARLGDRPRSAELHAALVPYADVIVGLTPLWCGSASHHLGVLATTLGRFDEAEARFAAAADLHGRIGAPCWLARTRLEWARMLGQRRDPGDAERAGALVARARATAAELGLEGLERAARSVPVPR